MSAVEFCPDCGAVVGGWFERAVRWLTRGKAPTISGGLCSPNNPVSTWTVQCRRCLYPLSTFTTFGPFVVALPGHSTGQDQKPSEETK